MKIVLFDMDGTLTPARQQMTMEMMCVLETLNTSGYKIGIVTGSSIDYIKDQCSILWSTSLYNEITYYPCNGTQRFEYTNGTLKAVYQENMSDTLGIENFNNVVYKLFEIQSTLKNIDACRSMPLTGNFIEYRKSMLNWCPIGRNASIEDRSSWVSIDKKYEIRNKILNDSFNCVLFDGLTVKLGGETSFDIHPKGWDKSFVMKNFSHEDDIWFIGDKCTGDGNDKALYDEISKRDKHRAYETSGTDMTINIIEKEILKTFTYDVL